MSLSDIFWTFFWFCFLFWWCVGCLFLAGTFFYCFLYSWYVEHCRIFDTVVFNVHITSVLRLFSVSASHLATRMFYDNFIDDLYYTFKSSFTCLWISLMYLIMEKLQFSSSYNLPRPHPNVKSITYQYFHNNSIDEGERIEVCMDSLMKYYIEKKRISNVNRETHISPQSTPLATKFSIYKR